MYYNEEECLRVCMWYLMPVELCLGSTGTPHSKKGEWELTATTPYGLWCSWNVVNCSRIEVRFLPKTYIV
jgi:hypothetical protein